MPSKGLCVFDVDNTLTRGAAAGIECGRVRWNPECRKCEGDSSAAGLGFKDASTYPAVYGKQAVKECLEHGYSVGVATFERCHGSGPAAVHSRLSFLQGLGMPSSVVAADSTGRLHRGPNLICKDSTTPTKGTMVSRLMHLTHTSPSHTIFFDDQKRFINQVKATHARTQLASSSCHGVYCPTGCGLNKKEFEHGLHKIR
eukprot:TRINITY_DN44820_c0_g1_i1.p1 TRINITY_DN44820_c0_g1~~TRINITY_DN44820_c0_g1_i1.p1  ORF type:complete len:221 (+),score=25.03 TRINITY_DN44820_c0_g1_i1:66-665(+)